MNYQQFKAIEQYFRLGELLEKNQRVLNSLSKLKEGFLSMSDLKVIQDELSSLGLGSSDYLDLNELYTALVNESNQFINARKEIKEMCFEINVDIDKIIYEKSYYENVLASS